MQSNNGLHPCSLFPIYRIRRLVKHLLSIHHSVGDHIDHLNRDIGAGQLLLEIIQHVADLRPKQDAVDLLPLQFYVCFRSRASEDFMVQALFVSSILHLFNQNASAHPCRTAKHDGLFIHNCVLLRSIFTNFNVLLSQFILFRYLEERQIDENPNHDQETFKNDIASVH